MASDTSAITAILGFLDRIGIKVTAEPLEEDGFLPAIRIRGGGIVYDPSRLLWPGDLLHEAGHIALTDPELRPALDAVGVDPGEEMGAIAWSWAAAAELGLDPHILFHDGGYRGGGAALIEHFTAGCADLGVPILAWHGMSREPHVARREGTLPFPHMLRWLR
jgi:hypothetical protein